MVYASKTAILPGWLIYLNNIWKQQKTRIWSWSYEWIKNRYISGRVYLPLIQGLSSNIQNAAEIEQILFCKILAEIYSDNFMDENFIFSCIIAAKNLLGKLSYILDHYK